MTIEFYAAHPQELVALYARQNIDGDAFFEQLATYPVADFSFHLWIPEDLDSLCQALHKQNTEVPLVFRELLVEQLWYDGSSESLTLLSERFAIALAALSENQAEQTALDWAATPDYSYIEPLQQTPAYQAFLQLRKVARVAVEQKKSLLLYLLGDIGFFRWQE